MMNITQPMLIHHVTCTPTSDAPKVAVAVITRARRICEAMNAWHPEAPLREFDFVMVKYGQKPGEFGIVRSLHNEWRPVQQIMEWQPRNDGSANAEF